jgi:hypothetical protein
MEGWNGEDENPVPTVTIFFYVAILGFAWGSRGVISKSLSGFIAMDKIHVFYKPPWTFILYSFF